MKVIHISKMINFIEILILCSLIFALYTYICQSKSFIHMPKPALFISGEILKRGKEQGICISNMSLQKLLFIANGAYLAETGNPLINEPIEVWPYGPVVKNVYHAFKEYGNTEIQQLPALYYLMTSDKNLDDTANEAIEFVLKVASKLDAIQLSNWTHLPGSPWSKANDLRKSIIPNEFMEEYFKQFIKTKEN